MLKQWLQQTLSRLDPGKTVVLVVVSVALGVGAGLSAPLLRNWLNPAGPAVPVMDARFIPLGRAYLPELGRVYAAAWDEGAKALEAGQDIPTALKTVGQSWDSGRGQLLDRLVTPEFSKIVPEAQESSKVADAERKALARAWRGFAAGLGGRKK